MKVFKWSAIDYKGKEHSGIHESSTRRESKVKDQIQRMNRIDISKCKEFNLEEVKK